MKRISFVVVLILLLSSNELLCYAQPKPMPGNQLSPDIFTGCWLVEYNAIVALPNS